MSETKFAPSLRRDGKPRVAITMGDPCGVGPEVLVKALARPDLFSVCDPVIFGDRTALDRAMRVTGASFGVVEMGNEAEFDAPFESLPEGAVRLFSPRPRLDDSDLAYGNPSRAACSATVAWIETAVALSLAGRVDAFCTCPIHKANLHRHGFPFPGHTEFIQDLTKSPQVVMMLAGPKLRVSLVTIHEAFSDVPRLLTPEAIETAIAVTGEGLTRDFGIPGARVAVAGLNPHAGEDGRFGREELDLIGPVVEKFRSAPFQVSGPWPPDTIFRRAYEGEFDAVVVMYHDQGLIPIKLVHFDDAVNVSLGLPVIRTSVDHGTAYDIAGTGKAHEGSLMEAVRLAALMAGNRKAASAAGASSGPRRG